MARPVHDLLADSLRRAKRVAYHQVIKGVWLSRIDKERLIKAACLQKIIRGWYLFCSPGTAPGESTLWYAHFWDFIGLYLSERFSNDYCLSAEASMDLYLGKNYLPPQVVVVTKSGGTGSLELPHHSSLFIYQETKNFPKEVKKLHGINVLPFEYALAKMPVYFYQKSPQEAELALCKLESSDRLLRVLLTEGMVTSAGRLAGALRHLKKESLANDIVAAMRAAGFSITETNPFKTIPFGVKHCFKSPYSARIQMLWKYTRSTVIDVFQKPARTALAQEAALKNIDNIYVQDAYHSLSIEGYKVSEALIEKIAKGRWHPEGNEEDQKSKDAMAAKGYYEAFQAVKETIHDMIHADSPMAVFHSHFQKWYLALFSPAVTAGIVPVEQLAGFRNQAVYIRNAQHVPPPHDAVRDCMETLFTCLQEEDNAAVRAVLMHWLIGFIHPYVDGNGRMARFAMNALLVSSGYPWTVIHLKNRKTYLKALDKASVHSDIKDFVKFIVKEMKGK